LQIGLLRVLLLKTNVIIFCSTRKGNFETQAKRKLNGTHQQVHFAKFLGIYIDEHLTWDERIQQVASKVSKV